MEEKTMNASQVARHYDISLQTVVNHINAGKLKATKKLKTWVITEEDMKSWWESENQENQ